MYSFSKFKRVWQGLIISLSFSSRLPLPQIPDADFGKAFVWLPPAGAILSLISLIPFIPGLLNDAWVAAWLYLAVYVWLNRALHWDGLADVADGLGSNKTGEAFWQVVKDSKLGAMGAAAILLAGLGYVVLAHNILEAGNWFALPWAAASARALVLIMPGLCPHNSRPGLGLLIQEGDLFGVALIWLFLLAAAGWAVFSFPASLLGLGLGFLVIWALSRCARRLGGFNGDFLGAGIVLSELAVMLGCALAAV